MDPELKCFEATPALMTPELSVFIRGKSVPIRVPFRSSVQIAHIRLPLP
jgi:hypothetical protein